MPNPRILLSGDERKHEQDLLLAARMYITDREGEIDGLATKVGFNRWCGGDTHNFHHSLSLDYETRKWVRIWFHMLSLDGVCPLSAIPVLRLVIGVDMYPPPLNSPEVSIDHNNNITATPFVFNLLMRCLPSPIFKSDSRQNKILIILMA